VVEAARHETPDLLTFTIGDLVSDEADVLSALDHPDVWVQGDLRLPLTYQFEPGLGRRRRHRAHPARRAEPRHAGRLRLAGAGAAPGARDRAHQVAAQAAARALRPGAGHRCGLPRVVEPRSRPLLDALETELLNVKRVDIRAEDWDLSKVPAAPAHDVPRRGRAGPPLAEGKDLDALKAQLQPKVQRRSRRRRRVERTGLTTWDVGTLPREVVVRAGARVPGAGRRGQHRRRAGAGDAGAAGGAHWRGTRGCCSSRRPAGQGDLGRMTNAQKLALTRNPLGTPAQVFEDCTTCALDHLVRRPGDPAWDADGLRAPARRGAAGPRARRWSRCSRRWRRC
jgi:ATP-dependent helicase HrpA